MAICVDEIPGILIERIEAAHPGPALFAADETEQWPDGVLPTLLTCGLLRKAARAQAITCPGCEWQCHKAVVVRRTDASSASRAFITCDEDPQLGRISVPIQHLTQYETTLPAIGVVIAGVMQLAPPRPLSSGRSFFLGEVRGRHGPRQLSLILDDGQLLLAVGQQHEPLVRLVHWSQSGFLVDAAHLRRLANRKEPIRAGNGEPYQPDRTRQKTRSRRRRGRDAAIWRDAVKLFSAGMSWSAAAAVIAANDPAVDERGGRLSRSTVRRIITERRRREREFSRSKRKKRK